MIYYILFAFLIASNTKGEVYEAAAPKEASCGTYQIEPDTPYSIATPFYQYGLQYPASSDCTWTFYGTKKCIPIVSCPEFKVAQSDGCSNDYLDISDGQKGSQKFCGTMGPMNMTTGISIMKARFKSGVFSSDKGFKCFVMCGVEGDNATLITNGLAPSENMADCQCGVPGSQKRIVGGEDAPIEYWKWQTALVFRSRNNPFCGGSLINNGYVLTAAHCVRTTGLEAFPAAAEVVFNEYDLSKKDETTTIRRSIVSIAVHPFYSVENQDYDVAVIGFSPSIDLASDKPKLTPVCLPPRGEGLDFVGDNSTITGWGVTEEDGDQPSILQQVVVPVISNEECNTQYKGKITERMICASYPEGMKDSCQGDSGGPMHVPIDDEDSEEIRWKQVGVVSWGEGCARPGKSGVYTRVTEVNDWIRQIAKGGTWCNE